MSLFCTNFVLFRYFIPLNPIMKYIDFHLRMANAYQEDEIPEDQKKNKYLKYPAFSLKFFSFLKL